MWPNSAPVEPQPWPGEPAERQEAARDLGPLSVIEARDWAGFLALEPEWNALVEAAGDHLFYRHEFHRLWLEAFAPKAQLRVIAVRSESGRLVGVLPLMARRASLMGLRVRQLVSTANAHSCRCDLVATEPQPVAEAILRYLLDQRGWDVLRLYNVPAAGQAWTLEETARRLRLSTGVIESNQSPYLPLGPDVAQRLSARRQSKIRRCRTRLEQLGPVSVELVEGGPELAARLREGLEIEASGWKGREGTAIVQDAATKTFYESLARDAAGRGRLQLRLLRVGGKAIAFEFGLLSPAGYAALKAGYDEAYAGYGPGQMLTYETILDCARRGAKEYDFLGQAGPEKLAWTDKVRDHHWLVIFRGGMVGRALCPRGIGWMPKAKGTVVEWGNGEGE